MRKLGGFTLDTGIVEAEKDSETSFSSVKT